MANDFTELIMWQKASELLASTVKDVESFPSKIGGRQIGDQLFRSVASISANIAEGFGRRSKREFAQACVVSRGETDESRNWYYQCGRIGLLEKSIVDQRNEKLMELRKMISSFIASLK
jgi:four helix bundle protein